MQSRADELEFVIKKLEEENRILKDENAELREELSKYQNSTLHGTYFTDSILDAIQVAFQNKPNNRNDENDNPAVPIKITELYDKPVTSIFVNKVNKKVYFTDNKSIFELDTTCQKEIRQLRVAKSIGNISSMAIDSKGAIYLCDSMKEVVLVVEKGRTGYYVAELHVTLNKPQHITLDKRDDIFVTDQNGIHKIEIKDEEPELKTIATLGMLSEQSLWDIPSGIAVDDQDNVYVTGFFTDSVYMIRNGVVSPFVGTPGCSKSQDGPLCFATLTGPTTIIVDSKGRMFVADKNFLRMIDIQNKMMKVIWAFPTEILCLAADHQDDILVGTSEGIYQLTQQSNVNVQPSEPQAITYGGKDYEARGIQFSWGDTDISFKTGKKMEVIESLQNGWIRVKLHQSSSVGLVPESFLASHNQVVCHQLSAVQRDKNDTGQQEHEKGLSAYWKNEVQTAIEHFIKAAPHYPAALLQLWWICSDFANPNENLAQQCTVHHYWFLQEVQTGELLSQYHFALYCYLLHVDKQAESWRKKLIEKGLQIPDFRGQNMEDFLNEETQNLQIIPETESDTERADPVEPLLTSITVRERIVTQTLNELLVPVLTQHPISWQEDKKPEQLVQPIIKDLYSKENIDFVEILRTIKTEKKNDALNLGTKLMQEVNFPNQAIFFEELEQIISSCINILTREFPSPRCQVRAITLDHSRTLSQMKALLEASLGFQIKHIASTSASTFIITFHCEEAAKKLITDQTDIDPQTTFTRGLLRGLKSREWVERSFWMNQERERTGSLDVCFVMDTTGSMGSYIAAAKKQINNIANHVVEKIKKDFSWNFKIRMSFVSYKDWCDGTARISAIDFHEYQNKPPNPLDNVTNFIANISASGGGDAPEDLLGGLQHSLSLHWSSTATAKFIILIADAPCHNDKYNGGGIGDSYPKGHPSDETPEKLLGTMHDKAVQFMFLRINSSTDFMIKYFANIYDKDLKEKGNFKLKTLDFNSTVNVEEMFKEQVSQSILEKLIEEDFM